MINTICHEAPDLEIVRLPGHRLSALAKASVATSASDAISKRITLTIVLKRDGEAAFHQYLRELPLRAQNSFVTTLHSVRSPTASAHREWNTIAFALSSSGMDSR